MSEIVFTKISSQPWLENRITIRVLINCCSCSDSHRLSIWSENPVHTCTIMFSGLTHSFTLLPPKKKRNSVAKFGIFCVSLIFHTRPVVWNQLNMGNSMHRNTYVCFWQAGAGSFGLSGVLLLSIIGKLLEDIESAKWSTGETIFTQILDAGVATFTTLYMYDQRTNINYRYIEWMWVIGSCYFEYCLHHWLFFQKENDLHRRNMKGGAFKLNMHAKSYFDENPYRSDRPLPPPKKTDGRRGDLKPFKPSSPGKIVSSCLLIVSVDEKGYEDE